MGSKEKMLINITKTLQIRKEGGEEKFFKFMKKSVYILIFLW